MEIKSYCIGVILTSTNKKLNFAYFHECINCDCMTASSNITYFMPMTHPLYSILKLYLTTRGLSGVICQPLTSWDGILDTFKIQFLSFMKRKRKLVSKLPRHWTELDWRS